MSLKSQEAAEVFALLNQAKAQSQESEPPEGADVQAARERVGEWHQKENYLAGRYVEVLAEEEEARKMAGGLVLDGRDPAEVGRAVASVQAEAAALRDAAVTARERRAEAIRATWKARAQDYRAKAAEVHAEADARQVRTDELLRELEEWEGARFVPYVPITNTLTHGPVVYSTPRTEVLRRRARELEAKAAALESREAVASGGAHVEGSSADVVRETTSNPMVLGPYRWEVQTWSTKAEAAARERRAQNLASAQLERERLEAQWEQQRKDAERRRKERKELKELGYTKEAKEVKDPSRGWEQDLERRYPAPDAPVRFSVHWRDGKVMEADSHAE